MITVEDGTVVANADSYISVADADTYFTEHGSPSDWTGATTAQKEAALKYATKWIDNSYTWYSSIYSTSQVLLWPRNAFYDEDGRSIGGSGNIPQDLKDAVCEMALEHFKQDFTESTSNIRRERIGSAEVEYGSSQGGARNYGFIHTLLTRLGRPKANQVRLKRG